MKNLILFSLCLCLLIYSCCSDNTDAVEKWKQEIVDTEEEFAEMVKSQGISKAFIHYADEHAVLNRGMKLIIGRDSIADFYTNARQTENVTLTWKPDFVDVSAAGDLGYTYGKFIYKVTDSVGNIKTSEGVFHTVWRKQRDGSWKYVWD